MGACKSTQKEGEMSPSKRDVADAEFHSAVPLSCEDASAGRNPKKARQKEEDVSGDLANAVDGERDKHETTTHTKATRNDAREGHAIDNGQDGQSDEPDSSSPSSPSTENNVSIEDNTQVKDNHRRGTVSAANQLREINRETPEVKNYYGKDNTHKDTLQVVAPPLPPNLTVELLSESLPPGRKSCCVFGAPANDVQRGFDSKCTDVNGGGKLGPKSLSVDFGIGYSCKKGYKPDSPNQDDFAVMRVDDWGIYGVFDGHGPSGHDISDYVHRYLPYAVMRDPQVSSDPIGALKRSFRAVHEELQVTFEHTNVDFTLSGTTATIVLHRDNTLYIAHVGDSRAVVAQRSGGGKGGTRRSDHLVVSGLTRDHKPTREDERKRIEEHGGEVRKLEGDVPHRVFVKDYLYPGLAMTRALGDAVGAAVGVIPDPEVKVVTIGENDVFLIMSTDGVWEFVSNQEAVDLVGKRSRSQVQEATDFLVYEAWRRWLNEEENVVDDVTCIVVWLAPDQRE